MREYLGGKNMNKQERIYELTNEVKLYLKNNSIDNLCKIMIERTPKTFIERIINKLYKIRIENKE